MAVGSRIDWGNNGKDFIRQSRKLGADTSFSSLLSRDSSPRSGKNNNKATGFVARGGGSASQRTAAGLSGLHKTLVDRKVNTGSHKNDQVTRGGGVTRRSVVQAKSASVRVKPEC